jgi:hypothetical protein
MSKPTVWEKIRETEIQAGETIQGQFTAQKTPPLWQQLLLGYAISAFLNKQYAVSFTERHLYFTQLHILTGKLVHTDAFAYSEIAEVHFKKSWLTKMLVLRLTDGTVLKFRLFFSKKERKQESFLTPVKQAALESCLQPVCLQTA